MQNRIALVSDDSDFFEYIIQKLMIRKNDEIFRYGFDSISDKIPLLRGAAIIINCENSEEQTIAVLKELKDFPVIVFAYNEDRKFENRAYAAGALSFITPFSEETEFRTKLAKALSISSLVEKKHQYREILVRNNIIKNDNEVFLDYENILDKELEKIKTESSNTILAAISPNEKTKFLLQPAQIEEAILKNIRKKDILMNFAPNKYFLLLFDTKFENAEKIWEKIKNSIPEKIYAGFANVSSKSRQQVVNEVLNRLHEAINCDTAALKRNSNDVCITGENFKKFRQEFNKSIEKTVIPVFYHIQQKYNGKLFNALIKLENSENEKILKISGRHSSATFKITSPGFSIINIDILYQTKNSIPPKRFSLEPNELEAGFLEDLLEQFVDEFRKEINDDNT